MNKETARIIVIAFCLALVLPGAATAQNYGPSLGIILGSPTGFTMKYVFAPQAAFAVCAGWGLVGNVHFVGAADYQFLFPQTLRWTDEYENRTHELPGLTPYFGLGGRLSLEEETAAPSETKLHVGVRLGGGVEYAIKRFGVFLDIFPVVDVIPATDFTFMGGIGFRIYFSGRG